MKYGTNTGLILVNKKDHIAIYSSSNLLKRRVKTNNNDFTWKLLCFLKTPKDKEEISKKFNMSVSETEKIISQLEKFQLIVKSPLTPKDIFFRLDRFINSLPQKKFNEYFQKSKNIKILILGVGTAGSYTIEFLYKLGFRNFLIIDSDIVEQKNLIAQNYSSKDIGLLKIDCLVNKYPECDIKAINQKINNYSEIKKIIYKYNPKYFLNNADDVYLTIEILSSVFHDFPNLKVIESGYSITDVQGEIIDKNNYDFFINQFNNVKNFFIEGNKFDGLADNSGTIFHAISSSFFSAKFIFDATLGIASSNFGEFDLLENKYFLDNDFYVSDFKNYKKRYQRDYKFIEEKNHMVTSHELDSRTNAFLLENTDYTIFKYLSNLKLNLKDSTQKNVSISDIRSLLTNYCFHTFQSGSDKLKEILKNLKVSIFDDSYSVKRCYTEHIGPFTNRIYLNDSLDHLNIHFIHEFFHTIFFEFSNNEYEHERFVTKNELMLVKYLKYTDNNLFNSLGIKIIDYISSSYLDVFAILEKEKVDFIGDSDNKIYDRLNINGSKLTIHEFDNYVHEITKGKRPFYFLKYEEALKDNFFIFTSVVKGLSIDQ